MKDLTYRIYNRTDYPKLVSWWINRDWPVPEIDFLPEKGIIITGDKDICAGFLYRSDSKLCWIGWPISDPNSDKLERREAVKVMWKKLEELARSLDYKWIWSFSGVPSVQSDFLKNGFNIGDPNVNTYIKRLV